MTIDNKFEIGEMVILKHDVEKVKRMVTRIEINCDGIAFQVTCKEIASWHYEFEMEKSNGESNKVGYR